MWQLRVGFIGLLALSAACGGSRAPGTSETVSPSNEIPVQIDNQNVSDMNIYVVRSGQRWLLGQASGLSKTTLTIRSALKGQGRVRLVAEPIGAARTVTTPTLLVPGGQSIFWTIGSDLTSSTVSTG